MRIVKPKIQYIIFSTLIQKIPESFSSMKLLI